MNQLHSKSVVVGIDGSQAAVNAAKCAVGEAISRQLPLRLVHVVGRSQVQPASAQPSDWEPLIDESQDAAPVHVGTDRRGWAAEKLLGATEAALATRAQCPVAIMQTNPDGTAAMPGVISVVLNDEADNDEVVHQAMEEGRRRNATVRQIDRRLNSWVRRYPDVPVQVVAAGTGTKSSENHSSAIELAVVGRADAAQIAGLATPYCHPIVLPRLLSAHCP
jgi:nucleotide-binding universal stress UspA family protein